MVQAASAVDKNLLTKNNLCLNLLHCAIAT